MQKNKRIGRFVAATLTVFLLSGCTAPAQQMTDIYEPLQLTMVVDSASPQNILEAAKEFINRASYYSNGELNITLQETENAQDKLASLDTSFAFLENSSLSGSIEELQTLELPFFFKNTDYQYSALNSSRTRKRLNELLKKKGDITLLMSTLYGYEDFAADSAVDLTDFQKQYPIAAKKAIFPIKIQQEIGAEVVISPNPFNQLLQGEVEIAPVELSQVLQAVKTEEYKNKLSVLDSTHQIKTAFLVAQNEILQKMTDKQRAAVEQAAVMACGYCRTLSDEKRSEELEELESRGVEIIPVNLEKYYAMMGDFYQFQAEELLYHPDAELDRLIRSDGVKKTF